MLKAIGKFIDTLPLKHLLSLDESGTDTVKIEVDRFHGQLDLSVFTFVMRGVSPSGTESLSQLTVEVSEDEQLLTLTWHISRSFTAESGTLFLDLLAYQYTVHDPSEEQPPDFLLRYQLPPVEIRNIPEGSGKAPDEESYTAFWVQVKERLKELENSVGEQGERIRTIFSALNAQSTQILELQDRIKLLVMTQEEYDNLSSYDPNIVYVLT